MRRLRSLATLAVMVGVLMTLLAVAGFATEGEGHSEPAIEGTEHAESDHAPEGDHATDDEHATEGEHATDDDHAEAAADGDDDQWLGLKASALAALVIGVLAFGLSGVKGLGEEAHH